MFRLKRRVVVQQLLVAHACAKLPEDVLHREPRALENGLAQHHHWTLFDIVLPLDRHWPLARLSMFLYRRSSPLLFTNSPIPPICIDRHLDQIIKLPRQDHGVLAVAHSQLYLKDRVGRLEAREPIVKVEYVD